MESDTGVYDREKERKRKIQSLPRCLPESWTSALSPFFPLLE